MAESFSMNTATWLLCTRSAGTCSELQVKDLEGRKTLMISDLLVPVNSGWFLQESGWYRVSDQFPVRIVRSQNLS